MEQKELCAMQHCFLIPPGAQKHPIFAANTRAVRVQGKILLAGGDAELTVESIPDNTGPGRTSRIQSVKAQGNGTSFDYVLTITTKGHMLCVTSDPKTSAYVEFTVTDYDGPIPPLEAPASE